jgi:hypothetical protein
MCANNSFSAGRKISVPAEYAASVQPKPFAISDADMCGIIAGVGNLGIKDKRVHVEDITDRRGNPQTNIILTVKSYDDLRVISHVAGQIRKGTGDFYLASARKLYAAAVQNVWIGFARDENGITVYDKDGLTVKELLKVAKEAAKGTKAKSREKAPVEAVEEEPAVAGKETPPSSTF